MTRLSVTVNYAEESQNIHCKWLIPAIIKLQTPRTVDLKLLMNKKSIKTKIFPRKGE